MRKLYDGPPAMDHPDDGGGVGIGDGNNNGGKDDGELSRRAICRIIQFRSTSDRLGSLCRHALHFIDGKSMGSSVESYSKGDEDERFCIQDVVGMEGNPSRVGEIANYLFTNLFAFLFERGIQYLLLMFLPKFPNISIVLFATDCD